MKTVVSILLRKVPVETRIKWTRVAFRIFRVIFLCYRLSILFFSMIIISIRRCILKYKQNEKQIKEDIISTHDSSRWSKEIPEEIMQLILQRLSIQDYIRCGGVCLSWRASVDMAISSKCCPPAPQLPWLMLSPSPYSLKANWFLRLSDEKIYKLSNPPSSSICTARVCVGSVEGWLIMVESDLWRPKHVIMNADFYNTVNFFLNPVSGAQVILLPSQSTIPCPYSSFIFFMVKVVASSPPTSSPHSCLVAGICSERYNLAFCRPTQKSWTLIHHSWGDDLSFQDIEIIDQKIYAATWKPPTQTLALMVFDINPDAPSYSAERLVILHPRPNMFRNIRRTQGVEFSTKNDVIYLAKDSASMELYMIFRRMSFADEYDPVIPWKTLSENYVIPPKTEGFQVFKFDHQLHSWKEVFDLNDQILFVSNASNKLIFATDLQLGAHNNHNIVEDNCIYFAFDCSYFGSSRFTKRDLGTFSMKNKSTKRFSNGVYFLTRLAARTVWFTPHPW